MKKITIIALAGSLGLAACDGNADTVDPVETEDGVVNTTPNDPVAVEQSTPEEGSSLTIDGGDVDATINEEGVHAEIKID
jgi:hypothetical protein